MSKAGRYEEYAFVADLYDSALTYRNRLDIAFYVEAAKEYGEPVLEIGCGTGRVLIPTARAGIEIVGMDLSTHMLGICRERLRDEPEEEIEVFKTTALKTKLAYNKHTYSIQLSYKIKICLETV